MRGTGAPRTLDWHEKPRVKPMSGQTLEILRKDLAAVPSRTGVHSTCTKHRSQGSIVGIHDGRPAQVRAATSIS
jgi:hypothetical protein